MIKPGGSLRQLIRIGTNGSKNSESSGLPESTSCGAKLEVDMAAVLECVLAQW